MTVVATRVVDWEAGKMVESHEQKGEDEESENGADVTEMGIYFISSQVYEE